MVQTRTGRDWSSFDEFVQLRGPALWRSAWLLTGDRQRAEDLVQDALARCWSKFDRLNTADDNYEAYVRKAIFNAHLGWWRRGTWRERTRELDDTADLRPEVPLASSDEGDLARALAGLPRQQRAVIVLRYYDDLTEAQTADLLGVSVGTVKQHAHRALANLRRSPHLAEADRAVLPTDPMEQP
ncbi:MULTISPECIES: SigE family RNA polymerase sigma factor [Aestuariimicrobium]|uniref:SigE family RNA polymerase sigma factor n=1 Tax=Aestuariimicrobium TaxID=396388 RepID=UPI00058CFDA0|nr:MULTISPECIES: SigE family RNA polymerase sigma factor [Aestuariimicrobium]